MISTTDSNTLDHIVVGGRTSSSYLANGEATGCLAQAIAFIQVMDVNWNLVYSKYFVDMVDGAYWEDIVAVKFSQFYSF
jgi:hypothetical protein